MDFEIRRYLRTSSSESYLFFEGENRLGMLDLHFLNFVSGTLIIERELSDEELEFFIKRIDSEIIEGVAPREDFILSVYSGKEIGFYSDNVSSEDRMYGPARIKDLDDISSILRTVIGNRHNLRGKLTEFVAVEFLNKMGYEASKASSEMDHNKVDIIATKENETKFVQVKAGQIGDKKIKELVKYISGIEVQGKKSIAIIAGEFSASAELIREELQESYSINIQFYHGYQVLKSLPEYKQALA